MAYLVDTNVLVDFSRGNSRAADYLDTLRDTWSLSTISALEVIAGARNQREVADLDTLLSAYPRIAATEDVSRRAY